MKIPLDYCYHCHTARCGHAFGEDDDFVLAAINAGIKVLCFTDHMPIPTISMPGIRMDISKLQEYHSSISVLKEKYKDKIQIFIGLECEYLKQYDSFYKELFTNKVVDMLILGQHGHLVDHNFCWYDGYNANVKALETYKNDVIEGLRSGYFSLLAHPDIIINSYQTIDQHVVRAFKEIVNEAVKLDIPLEINMTGVKNSHFNPKCYPCYEIWKIMSEENKNLKAVISFDAHLAEDFTKIDRFNFCLDIAKRCKVNLIDRITFKKII